jgi:Glycosyl hydrolase family 14
MNVLRAPWLLLMLVMDADGCLPTQIGQFQIYDRRAMASLSRAADKAGKPEWGCGPPPGIGSYNSQPQDTSFFTWNGGWQTPQGAFFLTWYSDALTEHAERLLRAAVRVFYPFMGSAAQAGIRERSCVPVAGLPADPPVRRNSSDIALDASVASLSERCSFATTSRAADVPRDGPHAEEHDASAGGVWPHAMAPNGSSGSVVASVVTFRHRPSQCAPNNTPVAEMAGHVNGLIEGADDVGPSCAGGVLTPCQVTVCDDARLDLEGAGRQPVHLVRSVCSSASLASSPTDPVQRHPLRVSMKLAGTSCCCAIHRCEQFRQLS